LFVDVSEPDAGGWYDLSEMLALSGLRAAPGPWEGADVAVREFEQNEGQILAQLRDRGVTSKLTARR
jgi:hypothetical protein